MINGGKKSSSARQPFTAAAKIRKREWKTRAYCLHTPVCGVASGGKRGKKRKAAVRQRLACPVMRGNQTGSDWRRGGERATMPLRSSHRGRRKEIRRGKKKSARDGAEVFIRPSAWARSSGRREERGKDDEKRAWSTFSFEATRMGKKKSSPTTLNRKPLAKVRGRERWTEPDDHKRFPPSSS